MKNVRRIMLIVLSFVLLVLSSCSGDEHIHSFGEWIETKSATCTENGEEERKCSLCGEKQKREISQNDHSFETKTTEKATCEKEGHISYMCRNCGYSYVKTAKAIGHNYKAATCTSPKKCSVCGKTDGEALGHKVENGTCLRCGEKQEAKIILPAAGETYRHGGAVFQITNIEVVKHSNNYFGTDETITVAFTIKMLSCKSSGESPWFKLKLFSSDGVLVLSGTQFPDYMNVGETHITERDFYNLKIGETYTLELLSFS